MLGIAIIPLMGAVGAAIDYSQANATRTAFQNALDATALMLSKTAAHGYRPADLQTNGDQRLQCPVQQPARRSERRSDRELFLVQRIANRAQRQRHRRHEFSQRPGHRPRSTSRRRRRRPGAIPGCASRSCSTIPDRWRVPDKMTALKTASQNLLTQLQSAAMTPDDVYVSIIPFNKDVNVDTSSVSAAWLRWDLWEAVNGKCSNTSYTTQSTLHVAQQNLDARQPQHLERLRHRPRPEFRHHQRRAGGRQHAVSDRAVCVLPGVIDGADQQLDRRCPTRSPPCSRSAIPTRRSDCRWAGNP